MSEGVLMLGVATLSIGCYGGLDVGNGSGAADDGDSAADGDSAGEDDAGDSGDPPPPEGFVPPPGSMRRLTAQQYQNSISDVFGPDIVLTAALEQDETTEVFLSIGAANVGTSEHGVEQYRTAAFDIAAQVFDHAADYPLLAGCTPGAETDPCVRAAIDGFGSALWRRPMTEEELDRYVGLVGSEAQDGQNFPLGLEYAIAALVESPNFIYIQQVGEPDPGSQLQRYTSYEMASRLSYFLWDSTPDSDLLAAAAAGDLLTAEGIEGEVDRMLSTERGIEAAARYFSESWRVYHLDELDKNVETYSAWTGDLLGLYRQEFQLFFQDLVSQDRDLRDVFTGSRTFVNADLATWYGLPPPPDSDFVEVSLDDTRFGILTSGAVVAANSPSDRTSPTLRGKFVLEGLLCLQTPPPPDDVDDVLPTDEPGAEPTTVREKLALHRSEPTCAACHDSIDPLGFAFEHYDGIGAYRTDELPGVPVDATGEFEDSMFNGAADLATFLANDDRATKCLVRRLVSYASGREVGPEDLDAVEQLYEAMVESEYRFRDLVIALATNPTFRYLAEAP